MPYHKTIFNNGLRVITVPIKDTRTVSVLVLVGTGSRYETQSTNGISHFIEHMFFKGTQRRPTPLKIAETLDKIGGAYNAFTSKEFTGYWAKVEKSYFDLALDWVADIFLNSKIPEREIEKERGVIIEEMNMYRDTPTRYISDLFEELLYGNQPMGWQVIGKKKNILHFKRRDFLDYLRKHYSVLNTVVCVAGNFQQDKALKKVEGYFQKAQKQPPLSRIGITDNQKEPGVLLHYKKTDQTHLQLGVRGFSLKDKEKYAQELIAIILGGNMSSRLFTEIREKRGLAYYIKTDSELYTDTGYLSTSAGVPHKAVGRVVELILKAYRKISTVKVSKSELRKAKDFLKGSATLSLESSDAQASYYGMQELLTEKILSPEEKFAKIDEVTVDDIQRVSRQIFVPQNLNLAIIGPYKESDKGKFLGRMNINIY